MIERTLGDVSMREKESGAIWIIIIIIIVIVSEGKH